MSERQNIEWKQCWSEGIFPNGLDIPSLKVKHNSRPQNPKIADACFKSGYIDAWCRGTLKIIEACRDAGLPEPELIEKDGGVQVTVFKGIIGGQIGGQRGGQINLTQRQEEVFKLILADPKISRRELAKKLRINESAIQKHLKVLTEQKILERIGTKNGYWKILVKK